MILDTTTKSLELVLGSAVTTTAMPVTVDYVDMTSTTTLAGSSDSQSNGVTPVTILSAPAASTQRKVNAISVYNADSVSKVVTVRLNNNTTLRSLVVVTLQIGETLGYSDTGGWYVQTTGGVRKTGVSIAEEITNTPAGSIAATTVQAAINELDSEKSPLAGSASITTVGALNSGSITSGFGAIDIGTDSLAAGSGTFSGLVESTATPFAFKASGAANLNHLLQVTNGSQDVRLGIDGSNNCYTGTVSAHDFLVQTNGATRGVFSSTGLSVTGIVTPEADNTRTLGTGALRWSTVYAGTGTINTSDAREKTAVRQLTSAEITASKQISQEIGAYQWLSAIAVKGTAAREHIGLTVQRAIEIMTANGLNPMAYGFICYDQWDATTVDHPEVLAQDATYDAEGVELTPAVEYKAAWTETTRMAGDRYSFRMDELNMFLARGFEARLAALEAV